MPYEVADAIRASTDDNTSVFQDAISDILADKLRERIGVERVAVSQTMFAEPGLESDEASEEELETEMDGESDEDV